MLEIKTAHGKTEGTITGDVGELIADIAVIAHAIYMQIRKEVGASLAKDFYMRLILTMGNDYCEKEMEKADEDKTENPDT